MIGLLQNKNYLKLFFIILLYLFNFKYVTPQSIRLSHSEFQLTMPLGEVNDRNFSNLLDTVLYYRDKCVFANQGTTYFNLFLLSKYSNSEKLLIEYTGVPFDCELEYRSTPKMSFLYKGSLFLVWGHSDSNQKWIDNQFDKLFINLDT